MALYKGALIGAHGASALARRARVALAAELSASLSFSL